ncbi:MAG: YdcH family protein [Paracoccaceae bacterium]
MSVESHLDHLRQKHQGLEAKIREEERRPGADNVQIRSLKREKLHLKDEIEKLSDTRH